MSGQPAVRVEPAPMSRLDQLAGQYEAAKAAAEQAAAHLKSITDAIKVELTTAAPEQTQVELHHEALFRPLRLQARTSWRLDTTKLKAEDPETYVRYARQSTYWELRAVSG